MTAARLASFAGSIVLLHGSLGATQTCHTATTSHAMTDWTRTIQFPRHDPAVGPLRAVRVRIDGDSRGTMRVENLESQAVTYVVALSCTLRVNRPNGSSIATATRYHGETVPLAAYDGTLDFGGASGATFYDVVTDASPAIVVELLSPGDLGLFTGPSGSPGAISLGVTSASTSAATGLGTASVLFAQTAGATVTVCYEHGPSASVPTQPTDWTVPITLPRFDPSAGALRAVRLRLTTDGAGNIGVENPSTSAGTCTATLALETSLLRPDSTAIAVVQRSHAETLTLASFDGTIDYGGTSGHTFVALATDPHAPDVIELTSPSDLALFTGASGTPGTITLSVRGRNVSTTGGLPGLLSTFTLVASASASVAYETALVQPFCFGSGGAACPCGNTGASGNGCASSTNTAGARLVGNGDPSVASDTFTLRAGGMPAASACIYFQGSDSPQDGSGVAFGDGLLCAGGHLARLRATANDGAGASSYPATGDPPVSVRGQIPGVGATRFYQCWYRDTQAFCTPATFNFTNAVLVGYTP